MVYMSNGQLVQPSNHCSQVWPSMQQSWRHQYQATTEKSTGLTMMDSLVNILLKWNIIVEHIIVVVELQTFVCFSC